MGVIGKVIGVLLAVIVLVAVISWLKVRGPDIPYDALEAKYTDKASYFVDLPGDYHVHYRDEGKADGPVLLLLHGYGDSFTSWEGWVKTLKDKYRLVSVDFPGHGLTRSPAGTTLAAPALADYLDAFAAAVKLPPAAVAGNSMGGGVAWQFALRHPDRVRALILVDAAGFPNDKPPGEVPLAFKILQYEWGRALLRNIDNTPLIRDGLKTDVYDKSLITEAVVARWAEFQRAPGHRAILMNMNPRGQVPASKELLAGIHVPTLVLWGEVDPLIEPAAAHKFGAAIDGAKVITYPNVGHLPQIEIPQRSAQDTDAFLSALPP